ncbi:MAG: DegV family protein [Gemmatimonadales bacterium]
MFPVPDGDTGTNFALTLRAVATRMRAMPDDTPMPGVTRAIAESCVMAARGNSGILLSQFLVGFHEGLGDRVTADAPEVASAMAAGSVRLSSALDEPVEGTILTVARDVAAAAERIARETRHFDELMRRLLLEAEAALARTPDLLAVLKDAGVVDAGAKAFVRLLEGIVRLIDGDPIVPIDGEPVWDVPDAAAMAEVVADRDYQYCTEILVRGTALPHANAVRTALRPLGGSIVILMTGDLLKVHVHTNDTEQIFALGRSWGAVEATKADDMRVQHRQRHDKRARVAVLVDSSSDLPDEIISRHGIIMVPVQVIEGTRTYRDRVEITADDIYPRMREGTVFTTSQPTPDAFVQGFEDALTQADQVLAILLAKALSGTYNTGVAAAKAVGGAITAVDSRSASLGTGLLAIRAVELLEQGHEASWVAGELSRIRDQSGGLFTVDVFDNLLRSGRVGRGKAWIGQLLDVKPILEVAPDGKVIPLDRVRGREALIPRVLRHLDQRLTPRPARLRIGIVHASAPDVAERLRNDLAARYNPLEIVIHPITAAVGVHTGPGAWGVFYQNEDQSHS